MKLSPLRLLEISTSSINGALRLASRHAIDRTFESIGLSASKGLPGVCFRRAEWNAIKNMQSGIVNRPITYTTLPTGPVERTLEYTAPFTLQNHETDETTV